MIIKGRKRVRACPKKEKSCDGYVRMYEYSKHLFRSTYEHMRAAQEMTISNIKYIVEMFNSDIEDICSINRGMREHIDSFHKYLERRAAYPEHSSAHIENVVNITVGGPNVIPQEKKWE